MKSNHKSFDWNSFINNHPLLGELSAEETSTLLDQNNSNQRVFKQGNIIFRAGEISNSFFLIGEGSVNVELSSDDSSSTNICTLYKGDYFGEMAAIDNQHGRAATISANEKCILLEMKSKPFQQILKTNPELEFKLLSMLTERLRHVNDQLLKNTRITYDSKFSILSEKIESQSKVVDASLKASQAVFEQTKIRTGEIIDSAERGRSRITWVMSLLTGGFTLLLTLISFLGYDKLETAKSYLGEIKTAKESIIQTKSDVDKFTSSIDALKKEAENLSTIIDENKKSITETLAAKKIIFETLITVFITRVEEKIKLKEGDIESEAIANTGQLGRQIIDMKDPIITIKLFKKIFFNIEDSHLDIVENSIKLTEPSLDPNLRLELKKTNSLNQRRIAYYTNFIFQYIDNATPTSASNTLAHFLSSYILMVSYAMNDEYGNNQLESFESIFTQLKKQYDFDIFSKIKGQLNKDFIDDLKEIDLPDNENYYSRKKSIESVWEHNIW